MKPQSNQLVDMDIVSDKKVSAKALNRTVVPKGEMLHKERVSLLHSEAALTQSINNIDLPAMANKRYFTIGEVSQLCGVKPHVLRYWEQEFSQLRPMKRRGNRRYYQPFEVLLVCKIRSLLYEQGFTISGARNQLHDMPCPEAANTLPANDKDVLLPEPTINVKMPTLIYSLDKIDSQALQQLRESLLDIRTLLD